MMSRNHQRIDKATHYPWSVADERTETPRRPGQRDRSATTGRLTHRAGRWPWPLLLTIPFLLISLQPLPGRTACTAIGNEVTCSGLTTGAQSITGDHLDITLLDSFNAVLTTTPVVSITNSSGPATVDSAGTISTSINGGKGLTIEQYDGDLIFTQRAGAITGGIGGATGMLVDNIGPAGATTITTSGLVNTGAPTSTNSRAIIVNLASSVNLDPVWIEQTAGTIAGGRAGQGEFTYSPIR
ncbi:MAG: hypothetical protein ACK5PS_06505 [Desulfopila sp.]